MKKLILTGLIATAGLFASSTTKAEVKDLPKNILLKQVNVLKYQKIKDTPFYYLKSKFKGSPNSPIVKSFVTKDGYLIAGAIFKPDGKKINFPIDKELIKKGVAFEYGDKTKPTLYLVTDPECPFCQKAEKTLGDKLAKNYNVKVILFPLSFHKKSKAYTSYILQGKTDQDKANRLKTVLREGENNKQVKAFMDKYRSNGGLAELETELQTQQGGKILDKNTSEMVSDYLKKSADAFSE